MAISKYRKIQIKIANNKTVSIYAGKRVSDAFSEVLLDLPLYKAGKLTLILEALYEQGKKDGARQVFAQMDILKRKIPHRLPGAPRKRQ